MSSNVPPPGVLWWACMSVCLSLCASLSVCMWTYLRNHPSKIHQMLPDVSVAWSSLGVVAGILCRPTIGLVTSRFPMMGSMAQVTQQGARFSWLTQQVGAPNRGWRLMSMIALLVAVVLVCHSVEVVHWRQCLSHLLACSHSVSIQYIHSREWPLTTKPYPPSINPAHWCSLHSMYTLTDSVHVAMPRALGPDDQTQFCYLILPGHIFIFVFIFILVSLYTEQSTQMDSPWEGYSTVLSELLAEDVTDEIW